jgi:hypothetical protein
VNNSGQPADSGGSGQVGEPPQPTDSDDSAQPAVSVAAAVSAKPDGLQEPSAAQPPWRKETLSLHVSQMRDMDTVDTCRMRLVALRTRIETNWPMTGRGVFNRGQGLSREATADITALLVALPTPLPLQAGGDPEPIIRETDTDMREVTGRAVDAGFALLEGATLETIYRGHVKMLEDHRPHAAEPIVVSNLTVGVLVATIIGTLDAIAETVLDVRGVGKDGASTPKAGNKPGPVQETAPPQPAPPKRGRRVPRI